MDTSANIVTTMGVIADEVYKSSYFIDEYNLDGSKKVKTISGTTYKILEHTPATDGDFSRSHSPEY